MPEADAKSVPRTPNWLIFSLVAIGIFMATLDGSIVNIALPSIMTDFEVELATIQWVVMIYLLTVTSLLLSFGRLSDIRGRRIVYSLGLFLFSFGSLFCGLAQSAQWLIISRFFQGLGAAMTMACTPALIVDTFPETERGRALGMMGSVVASGLTAGPVLGGLLIHYFSWRAIFYINIPIGLLTAAAAVPRAWPVAERALWFEAAGLHVDLVVHPRANDLRVIHGHVFDGASGRPHRSPPCRSQDERKELARARFFPLLAALGK